MEHRRHSYHRKPRPKRSSRVTVPDRVGPHVKLVFSEIFRQGYTYDEVEQGSGVQRTTLKAWRIKNAPGLMTLEAVLGFLGWDFLPIPRARVLPPALVADLAPIAVRHGVSMEESIAAFLGIAARDRGLNTEALPFVPALQPYQPPPAAAAISFSASVAARPANGLSCAA